MPRRYAIVDVGSNSIRLVVFEPEPGSTKNSMNSESRIVYNKKAMAGLAGYVEGGKLSQAGIDKAVTTLQKHLDSAANLDVAPEDVHVFATAGLRNVSNSRQACKQVAEATGIQIDLLSGEEEARLGMLGCRSAITGNKGLVVDVGGGSTEITTWAKGKKAKGASLPFGSLYLYLNFVSDILPTRGEMCRISEYVRGNLEKLDIFEKPPYGEAVGIGGSARSSIKIVRSMVCQDVLDVMTTDQLETVLAAPALSYRETLHEILRICPDRVHTVMPGLTTLWTIMDYAGVETVRVSKSGIREGYLMDRVLGVKQK